MPLPNPEPIGLPAPVWLLQVLLVLTFSLHIIAMTITVGGSILGLQGELMARLRPASTWRRLANAVWGLLPSVTAFTITLGIAPLLFVQLAYGKFFYPASVLTGWSWFAVVPLLMVGYGALYVQAMSSPEAKFRVWAGLGSVAAFLGVMAIYVSTMSLSTEPGVWKELYAADQGGLHFFGQLPRWLHVVLGATAMGGGIASLLGHLAADEKYSRLARRVGLAWLAVSLAAQLPVSLWYQSTLLAPGADAVRAWLVWPAAAVGALALVAAMAAEIRGARSPLAGWATVGLLGAGTALLAVQRHLVRQAMVDPHLTAADWKLQPQWDVFAIFAVLLVGTLSLIAYMLVRYARSLASQQAKHPSRKAG